MLTVLASEHFNPSDYTINYIAPLLLEDDTVRKLRSTKIKNDIMVGRFVSELFILLNRAHGCLTFK